MPVVPGVTDDMDAVLVRHIEQTYRALQRAVAACPQHDYYLVPYPGDARVLTWMQDVGLVPYRVVQSTDGMREGCERGKAPAWYIFLLYGASIRERLGPGRSMLPQPRPITWGPGV